MTVWQEGLTQVVGVMCLIVNCVMMATFLTLQVCPSLSVCVRVRRQPFSRTSALAFPCVPLRTLLENEVQAFID